MEFFPVKLNHHFFFYHNHKHAHSRFNFAFPVKRRKCAATVGSSVKPAYVEIESDKQESRLSESILKKKLER